MSLAVTPGQPFPLGPSFTRDGVNLAVYAGQAHALDLCLYDPQELDRETGRIRFPKQTGGVWHVHVGGLAPGSAYGLRAHGPWDPSQGLRYHPAKLLLDPHARALTGPVAGHPLQTGENEDGSPDTRDSAPSLPRCLIVDGGFDWGEDAPPRTRWDRTVIYETHVRGTTMRHPDVPEPLRGTFAGLASQPMIDHFQRLGVTAVQLLPVQQHIDDHFLIERGLTNYWGYQPVAWFAPQHDYAAKRSPDGGVREFKEMVRALHAAGLEVILDVVYNHSGKGGARGAVLNFRGLDNASYFRLDPRDPRHDVDYTGTGNTLDLRHPRTLQYVLDSMRYWVTEMHVDGFRFDLAAALGRESDDFDPNGGFFRAVSQDPVLSTVKLIAEPWDTGPGGYQVGGFPHPFVELNGKFRDDVRAYWRGDPGSVQALAWRLTGSEDLYHARGRPQASVNLITSHDGFTLADLVSYNGKHNTANGEENRDGDNHNLSWNSGVEGETDDPAVLALRARRQRSLLATLFLSQGVPFLLGGDELGRTQKGNNNAYCQDNEISWFDWAGAAEVPLAAFIRGLIDLRNSQPAFRKRRFLHGNFLRGSTSRDVMWLTPEGRAMTDRDWHKADQHALGMLLSGSARSTMSDWRRSRHGDAFLVLFNANTLDRPFLLPGIPAVRWAPVLDTALDAPFDAGDHAPHPGHSPRVIDSHAMAVFRLAAGTEREAQTLLP